MNLLFFKINACRFLFKILGKKSFSKDTGFMLSIFFIKLFFITYTPAFIKKFIFLLFLFFSINLSIFILLLNEIKRVKESDLPDKERQLKKLKKRYTIGNVNFDSIIIADFDESLKSVITSFLYSDVSPKKKSIITFNQWFDESLIKEKTIQPIYYPSINKNNLKDFKDKFFKEFNEYPSYLSLLSYDLVGLIYYLSLNTELNDISKLFKKKNSFKGKIGIFDIKDNKINHRLNLYEVNNEKVKEIF